MADTMIERLVRQRDAKYGDKLKMEFFIYFVDGAVEYKKLYANPIKGALGKAGVTPLHIERLPIALLEEGMGLSVAFTNGMPITATGIESGHGAYILISAEWVGENGARVEETVVWAGPYGAGPPRFEPWATTRIPTSWLNIEITDPEAEPAETVAPVEGRVATIKKEGAITARPLSEVLAAEPLLTAAAAKRINWTPDTDMPRRGDLRMYRTEDPTRRDTFEVYDGGEWIAVTVINEDYYLDHTAEEVRALVTVYALKVLDDPDDLRDVTL